VIDLVGEGPSGRNGEFINLCVGRQPRLEPELPHVYILKEDAHVIARG